MSQFGLLGVLVRSTGDVAQSLVDLRNKYILLTFISSDSKLRAGIYSKRGYLRGNKFHLIVAIDLSRLLHDFGLGAAGSHGKIIVNLAFLAELQCTTGCSTSRAVTIDLSLAGVLAQLGGVTDTDVRREEDEEIAS